MKRPKTVRQIAAQGDVLFRRVAGLPDGAKAVPRDGALIVAHSETGHHHLVESPHARLYAHPTEPLVSYLAIAPKATHVDVVHARPWDTHETLRLLADGDGECVYEIRQQREWAPEGWRKVVD